MRKKEEVEEDHDGGDDECIQEEEGAREGEDFSDDDGRALRNSTSRSGILLSYFRSRKDHRNG